MVPPGKVLRLFPVPVEEMAPEEVYAHLRQRASDAGRAEPRVAINMVSTLDGKVSVGGQASPIGSGADRLIMRSIRSAFDAVLVGAGTVRAEEMNLGVTAELAEKRTASGLTEQPLGVVLAGSGELPLERKVFRPLQKQSIVVIAGGATPKSALVRAEALGLRVLLAQGPGVPSPQEILRLLAERLKVRSVLLEGGPTINSAFLAAGKADELFMTLSPKISPYSEDAPPAPAATPGAAGEPAATNLRLVSVHASEQQSELYLRYARTAP